MKMGPPDHSNREKQRLPIAVSLETLPPRPSASAFLEFPGHAKAVQDAVAMAQAQMESSKWQLEDFIGYRVRVAYPPAPSFVGITVPLNTKH
jgi:hypothetical protein